MDDKRMQRGPLKLIVHVSLVHATETDEGRVDGSIQPHSIGTHTLKTQRSAGGSACYCWVCEGREDTSKNG
jgi:hypothetical protein